MFILLGSPHFVFFALNNWRSSTINSICAVFLGKSAWRVSVGPDCAIGDAKTNHLHRSFARWYHCERGVEKAVQSHWWR